MEHINEIIDLDTLVNQLNDQIGHMGNNLIQVVEELDYFKEEYLKLIQINKRLISELYEKNNRIHRHDIRNTIMRY
uniref:Uncharacterized protein n=1 Tax=viral metagenome TaxID=1070528 RepID=A0A6C0ET87_9ZZZZ